MPRFEPGQNYPRAEVQDAFSAAKMEGPFLVTATERAFIARLGDGPSDPNFPERSTLRWPGEVPKRLVERRDPLLVFVERADDVLEFLGAGQVGKYRLAGSRVRDLHIRLSSPRRRSAWLRDLGSRLPPLGQPPEAAIAALAPDARPEEHWAALVTFLERWYGKHIAVAGGGAPLPVGPPLLRKIHAVARDNPEVFTQNHLIPRDRLAIEEGRVTFYCENQGVCLWATESDGPNPHVWFRVNDPTEGWLEEPERLSGFLIQAVLFDATMNSRFGAFVSCADAPMRDAVVARVDPLSLERWNWLGARFYARDGALVMTMENDGLFDLWIAAATPLALSAFEEVVTPDWDFVAF